MRDWPEYQVWAAMVQRCTNPKNTSYARYGAKGVFVCAEWMGAGGFARFIAHIGRRPTAEHQVDRYPDQRGGYAPGNVRWATRAEQMRNVSSNRNITIDGRTLCLADWAAESGLDAQLIQDRIDELGWTERDAVLTPVHRSMITVDGVTKSAADWSRERFGDATTITKRIGKGWDPTDAVLVPKGMTRAAWRARAA